MPQVNLIQVTGSSYYCSGRLSIGVYIFDGKALIIDSGIDDAIAKAIDKTLLQHDCIPVAIINTHSHADHCGGNQYFQNKYKNIRIYASKYEQHYIEDPVNEPRCFCCGANPLKELRNRHLEAKPSTVTNVIHPYQDQTISIEGRNFRIITLPGHTPGMIGVITPDQVLYSGDAIFGHDTFEKHGILFYTDIEASIATFDKIYQLGIEHAVLYHGEYCNDIGKKALAHKQKLEETADAIADIISHAKSATIDDVTSMVIRHFNIPQNVTQFVLTRTCVNAYISYLQKQGRINTGMQEGALVVNIAAIPEKAGSTPSMTM
ncbi:MAG TPA: MBL fold metallo-hydrolase [Gammaproteobacteria bacterium]|jgi:glyoxylase-like metal-dependent hydrolase (beta-lactamase superfamily II)|nr:MBL fold metallo-hydrolase [Gammaproteobacteria bacterium]